MSGSRRRDGRLGAYVDGYRAWLLEIGYSPLSVASSLAALGHLGRWMQRYELEVDQLDDEVLRGFLAAYVADHGHLPTAGVRPLLSYLRGIAVVAPEPMGVLGAVDRLLDGYRRWLMVDRELAPDTVRGYVRTAHRFLGGRVAADGEVCLEHLTGADVTGFLLEESARVKPGSVACHGNQLRSLLRFLAMRGLTGDGLADAVPPVGRWRDSGLPQFPPQPEVERLLGSCDRSGLVGARDFAILMLLARLGLRTIEVCRLELGAVNWRAGEIEVDGKGRERAALPLPADVGDALACYLLLRGRAESPRVFLTVKAPARPIEPTAVRSVVRDACDRAGLERVGAHRLRHALASDMLRHGASLIEIGQVLRHKHLESTAIYAKVDLQRLRQAARPWPGAAR